MDRILPLAVALSLAVACTSKGGDAASDTGAARAPVDSGAAARPTADSGAPSGAATRVLVIENLKAPESVKYDADQDVYFVSNVNGVPSDKDGNGYVSRVRADGTVDSAMFVAGGRGGVTLNAPKGLAIVGDTLWVADVDAVRAFNRRTGAPVANVDLAPMHATFLNDIAVGPDGAIYVTDTGVHFGSAGQVTHPGVNRIFRIANRRATVAAQGDALGSPNGIAWDSANARFIVGPFGANDVLSWKPGAATPTKLASGPGQYDGLEVLRDGRVLVTSWTDSSVHAFANGATQLTGDTRIVTGVGSPADIGYDTKRNRLLIPRLNDNRVEVWQLK